MSRAKPSYIPTPRTWDAFQVAARLGKGREWLKAHRQELEADGFPRYDDLLHGWDANAIEAWLDKRSGLATVENDEQAWLGALSNGKGCSAIRP